jgi:hypothetical protein
MKKNIIYSTIQRSHQRDNIKQLTELFIDVQNKMLILRNKKRHRIISDLLMSSFIELLSYFCINSQSKTTLYNATFIVRYLSAIFVCEF